VEGGGREARWRGREDEKTEKRKDKKKNKKLVIKKNPLCQGGKPLNATSLEASSGFTKVL